VGVLIIANLANFDEGGKTGLDPKNISFKTLFGVTEPNVYFRFKVEAFVF
jgi:hypothetical protein